MNEVNEFLKDTEQPTQELDILDQPLVPEGEEAQPPASEEQAGEEEQPESTDGAPAGEESGEEEEPTEIKPKNRRERRLRQRLDAERNSSMQLANTVKQLTDANKSIEDADYLKGLDQIYGNDTPEATMATNLLKTALVGMGKDAEERAYQRVAQEQQNAANQQQEAQNELDGFIDDIEDTYNVEFSETQERGFFQLLHKMSPKDANGNVIGYADPHSVYEVFKERTTKKAPVNKQAKKIANRSLQQGGAPEKSTVQEDSTVRFLKDSGII